VRNGAILTLQLQRKQFVQVNEGWFGFGILFIPKLKEIMFL